MKSKFSFGAAALAAMMLASCSSEELIESGVNDTNAISFGVTSEMTSRSVESYCNTNLPGDFTVTAKVAGTAETYFSDLVAKRAGQSTSYELGQTIYWPASALDFVAWKNDNGTYAYNAETGVPAFNNFKPAATAQEQLDLLYAVKNNQSQQQVKLNFRHALSQIVFRADNASGLNITISGVKVGNAYSEGSFTFPTLDTDPNYTDHSDDPKEQVILNQGTWAGVESSARVDYTVAFPAKEIGTDIVNLTSVNHKQGGDLSMILLPQTANAWDPTIKSTDMNDYNGSYFWLDVKMTNGEGTVVYEGPALVPAKLEWKQGVRYIYTFHFTEGGNGGYRPDPVDPKPVLGGISFDVQVDDFIPADGGENDMNATQFPEADKEYDLAFNIDAIDHHETKTVKGEEKWEVTVPAQEPAAVEGKKFLGWAETEGATEAAYKAGDVITIDATTPNVNLFPVYADLGKATVKIAALNIDETLYIADGAETVAYTIPTETPAKEGFTFQGWATAENAEAADEAYAAGTTVNLTAGQTLELFPVFTENLEEIVINFNLNGGSCANLQPLTFKVKKGESATTDLPALIVTAPESQFDISFEGWLPYQIENPILASDNELYDQQIIDNGARGVTFTESTTLYAVYRATVPSHVIDQEETGGEVD